MNQSLKQNQARLNQHLIATPQVSSERLISRPMICYYSQSDYNVMKEFISPQEKADYYLEKPLRLKELVSLLRLINIL